MDRMTSILEKAEKLNKQADEATKKLMEIEDKLVKAGVGVEVWMDIGVNNKDPENPSVYSFGFAKSKSWGFFIRESWSIYYQVMQTISEAPRQLRIKAAECTESLLEQIDKELSDLTKKYLEDK